MQNSALQLFFNSVPKNSLSPEGTEFIAANPFVVSETRSAGKAPEDLIYSSATSHPQ
jgi:hypothetical protein